MSTYRREWSKKQGRFVWLFDYSPPGLPRTRGSIVDSGQLESELQHYMHTVLHAEAQRKAQELRSPRKGSLTFGHYIEHYRENAGKHAKTSLVSQIEAAIGSVRIVDGDFAPVEFAFLRFMADQEGRPVCRWKGSRKDGGLEPVSTGRTISEATLQGYRRYFCCICGAGRKIRLSDSLPRILEEQDPSASVTVGKPIRRDRPITEDERAKIYKALAENQELAWLKVWIDFAKTMPIRPEDMVALRARQIDLLHDQIVYEPGKTFANTEVVAAAAILPHMREYMESRVATGLDAPVFHKDGQAIGYWSLAHGWQALRKKAGVTDFRFYDWRHDAVNYLLSLGFDRETIKQFAGWSTDDMIDTYNTQDRGRLAKVVRQTLKDGNREVMAEVA